VGPRFTPPLERLVSPLLYCFLPPRPFLSSNVTTPLILLHTRVLLSLTLHPHLLSSTYRLFTSCPSPYLEPTFWSPFKIPAPPDTPSLSVLLVASPPRSPPQKSPQPLFFSPPCFFLFWCFLFPYTIGKDILNVVTTVQESPPTPRSFAFLAGFALSKNTFLLSHMYRVKILHFLPNFVFRVSPFPFFSLG